jgi:hypothetical protein
MVTIIRFEERRGVKHDIEKTIKTLRLAGCDVTFLTSGSMAEKHGDPFDRWFKLETEEPVEAEAKKNY